MSVALGMQGVGKGGSGFYQRKRRVDGSRRLFRRDFGFEILDEGLRNFEIVCNFHFLNLAQSLVEMQTIYENYKLN